MAKIFVSGSADGLGRAAALTLMNEGHEVVVHARSKERLSAVEELLRQGAKPVVADLSDLSQILSLADQVNRIGRMNTIIHNAGVYTGSSILAVNVLAPYLLTAKIEKPDRLIYLSSGMHLSGRPDLRSIASTDGKTSYSDSKLFVTTLAAAVARLWPDVITSSVDPGWVPTKMGGANAPDDLRLGHKTQEWLATSNEPKALESGGYWHHQKRRSPHPASQDLTFQENLLAQLKKRTEVSIPLP